MLLENVRDDAPQSKLKVYLYAYSTDDPLTEEQIATAVQLLYEAAESGDAIAQYNLGALYRTGPWIPTDEEQSLAWTVESAKNGLFDGQISSGIMFHDAATLEPDEAARGVLLVNSRHWLEVAFGRKDIADEHILLAQTLLARTINFETLLEEEAWYLMLDASCRGQETAIAWLEYDTKPVMKWAEAGNDDAIRIVTLIDSFDRSDCVPDQ